jgi:hypothetical protein
MITVANSTTFSITGNTSITGFANVSVSVNTASFTVGTTVVANATGTYATQLNGQLASYYTDIPARLGYTPVQQGGGTGQGTNKIYVGWLGSTLGLQVDSTNFGASWPISITGSAATATDSTKLPLAGGTMTGTITSSVGGSSISLTNGTANRITWNTGGIAAPTFTSYSAGTKLVLYDNVGAASAGYAIGIESGAQWYSVESNLYAFKWYGGTTNFMSANTTGLSHTGNITAYSSDRRLKKNITAIEDPIKKVQQIGGYTFDWNKELCDEYEFIPGNIHEHGVIAQEIEKIVPDAVTRAPFDIGKDGESKTGENYLTVRYDRIVPLLIEAIKEQQNQIDELKRMIYDSGK